MDRLYSHRLLLTTNQCGVIRMRNHLIIVLIFTSSGDFEERVGSCL